MRGAAPGGDCDAVHLPALPFLVAVNCFPDARSYGTPVVLCDARSYGTPVVLCDARDRDSGKGVLIRLVEHARRVRAARLLESVS